MSTSASAVFVQKRGFLYKLGKNVKSWKLRYIVLNPGYFCYYKDASVSAKHKVQDFVTTHRIVTLIFSLKELKPIGEVKLKNVSVKEADDAAAGKQPHQFVVHTESSWNNRDDWILAAVKAEELQDWITAFRLASQGR